MASPTKRTSRFFDINYLIKERDKIRELRCKTRHREEQNEINLKRPGENMYVIKNKVFHYKFNPSLIPEKINKAEDSEPNVKRRIIQEEDVQEANEIQGLDMDVEPPVSSEPLLPSDLEVVSPVPPEIILEPSSSNYVRISEVENFAFDPSWKPSPNPVSASIKNESEDNIQLLEAAPQNASAGHFDKYKTCFKRRIDLRMKDAVDCGEEDVSLDHPRLKYVTTYLRNIKRNNTQHWTRLKNKFSSQPLENDSDDFTDISSGLLFPINQSDIDQISKSNYFQTPTEFFNQQTLHKDHPFEYVQNL